MMKYEVLLVAVVGRNLHMYKQVRWGEGEDLHVCHFLMSFIAINILIPLPLHCLSSFLVAGGVLHQKQFCRV